MRKNATAINGKTATDRYDSVLVALARTDRQA
jgi:hypothetical protein